MRQAGPLVVGIGGTTRAGSTSERALRLALEMAARDGARVRCFAADALPVAPYDPGLAARGREAAALVEALREADGVILASPGYHGSVSGLVKNAIDYAEDLRDDARPYLDGRAVGCIVSADGPQAQGSTLAALRAIVHALRGWPTPSAALVDAPARPFDADGRCTDTRLAAQIERVALQVTDFARLQRLRALER